STRDHVEQIEMVLAGGECLTFGDEPLPPLASAVDGETAGMQQHRELVEQLARLLAANRDLIRERQPPLLRNRCGYLLRGVLEDNRLRLARMLVGAEGTLGLITSAKLYTAPLPAHRGVVLLLFG